MTSLIWNPPTTKFSPDSKLHNLIIQPWRCENRHIISTQNPHMWQLPQASLPPPSPPIRLPSNQIFIPSPPKINSLHYITISMLQINKNFIFSTYTIFISTTYSFCTQVILILDFNQCSIQNVAFIFKRGRMVKITPQDSHHLIKKSPNIISHNPPHNTIWKTLNSGPSFDRFWSSSF